MSWIDSAIGLISPQAELRRLRARALISELRGYEGAKRGRRTDGWRTSGASANAEALPSLPALRARSRDLVRNSPHATKALSELVSGVFGTGIRPVWGKSTRAAWKTWAEEECDAEGQLDFHGLQRLIGNCFFESGEVLVRFRIRRPEDGLRVPLQLQVLEPDFLDSSRMGVVEGNLVIGGVAFDRLGRRVGYWLFPEHPGEVAIVPKSLQSRFVPATEVVHLYSKDRPGQVRGVPQCAPVILKHRDFADYQEAELMRKKIEACFAVFVRGDDDSLSIGALKDAPAGSATGTPKSETLRPGMIKYLKGAEDVSFANPTPSASGGQFESGMLHTMAAGWRLTYERMTGDFSKVNYSSARAGENLFRDYVEQVQWLTVIPMLLRSVTTRWAVTAKLAGVIADGEERPTDWTTPRLRYVDPAKEIKADKEAMLGGLKSWREGLRERGYDPDQVLAELIEERKAFAAAGLLVDTNYADVVQGKASAAPAPSDSDAEEGDDEDEDTANDEASATSSKE
jgi:lambda family phage portal protein